VVAGAIARQLLKKEGITVSAYVSQVGAVRLERPYQELELAETWKSDVRCPDPETAAEMTGMIEMVRGEGDSIGGVVSCVAQGVPPGLGEPVFDRLEADLAKAMLSINATKGFQIGSGFGSPAMRGSEHNDAFIIGWRKEHSTLVPEEMSVEKGAIRSATNHGGGTQGGISSGEDICFDVAFKPPATIAKAQLTVNTRWEEVTLEAKGRHDPCVVPRAVPIVEAMTCLVLVDHLLRQRSARL
jgi:chorismate synthase